MPGVYQSSICPENYRMNKLNTLFVLIIMQLSLAGCSDLFGKKVVEKAMSNGRLKANCELNMDAFKDILRYKITADINCLEKTLNLFMDVSELGKGGKLSRVALTNYLKRNRPDTDPKTYSVIDSIFALSRLITAEEKDFVSRGTVKHLMELMREFNLHAYRHYENTFGSKEPANLAVHESHRARVEAAAQDIKAGLQNIYVADRDGEIQFVQLMDIIKGFISDDEEAIKEIEGLLFAKKIIMGGEKETITHVELGFLFENLPKILSLVLDGVRFQYLEIKQRDTLEFIRADVVDLANILFHPARGNRYSEAMFNVDEAIAGIDGIIKEDDDKIAKYAVLIKEGIRIFTKTRTEGIQTSQILNDNDDEQIVYGKDLQKIFDHIFNVTKRGLAFHRFYNSPNIKPLLDAPVSAYIDPKKYELEFPLDKVELVEFARVVNTFRYMKGSENMATYSLEYKRNATGTAEIAMYEYAIKNFFGYYGSSLSMGDKQLREILKKFEGPLIEMDIIMPRRSRSTAETISLMGSLFQSQSDDNKVLDVDEAAEFAVSLVTAIDAKKSLFAYFDDKNCKRDEFNRIDPACFKEHFYASICTNYRDKFPRLFQYMGADGAKGCEQNFNSDHNIAYVNASAEAARTCHIYPDDSSEIYYSESDVMSIMVAMMHIETTITRWDKNLNNTMDPEDVMDAFTIYKPAIAGMLPEAVKKFPPKLQDYLTKVVFQYLVKFEDTPKLEGKDIVKTIGNLAKLIAKKGTASRKTIASILRIVSAESKKKALAEYEANPNDPAVEKPFDCNWLRDPENIPRD